MRHRPKIRVKQGGNVKTKGDIYTDNKKERQSPVQGSYGGNRERTTYREMLIQQLPAHLSSEFLPSADGSGNLQYIIAIKDGDLSTGIVLPFSASPEARAYKLLEDWMPNIIPGFESRSVTIFLKHTLQSLMGTHCVFALEFNGFEIDEHSFVVHLDQKNHVVMVCCTYLPNLPELLPVAPKAEASGESLLGSFPDEQKVKDEITSIGEYDDVNAERLWLVIWDEQSQRYEIAPGEQVKVSQIRRPRREEQTANVYGVTKERGIKRIDNSPRLAARKLGLGEILRTFQEDHRGRPISILNDENIGNQKREGILLDLESSSELVGRYAAIKDQIAVYSTERNGIFTNESGSYFDRVNAYYHLDYIQRYFREKLGLYLLDNYAHLNPVRIVLAPRGDDVAYYDVNSQKITLYQLGLKYFTAARDPRVIYHEFVHIVNDAIARMHRAGRLLTPRASEALQAQAMDEGTADYFACSLAAKQGANKALFYYRYKRRWTIHRNLDPQPPQKARQEQIDTRELDFKTKWSEKKYSLAENWGRYLWQLRKSILAEPELVDIMIVHSLFFLTRWATFTQGREALRLADRLLFAGKHEKTITDKYEEVMAGIEFKDIPFTTISQPETRTAA